jgi:tRNA (guanine37-N1)-methyltransferase
LVPGDDFFMPESQMRIDLLTIFPDMFSGPLTESLLQKAQEKKILDIAIHDIRSFTKDRHRSVDDRPFGGGPGMVMNAEPVYEALKSLGAAKTKPRTKPSKKRPLVIYLSPQGETLNQKLVNELAGYKHLVLLCGHYEGIDERAMRWVDREISIGDYVLTGGELPAMVLIDCVARLLPGVVKETQSVAQDSFFNGLLDYPHYTRPLVFKGQAVPETLLSGHHAKIEQWRREQSLIRTMTRRPELLKDAPLTGAEKEFVKKLKKRVRGS